MATQKTVEPHSIDSTLNPERTYFGRIGVSTEALTSIQLGNISPGHPLIHIQYVNVKLLFATTI